MRYSWFTVGLPESTQVEAVALMKKYGYNGIEWRVVADKGDTAKPGFWSGNKTTLQDDWDDSKYKEIADMTRSEGLDMPNLGSYAKANDLEKAKRMIEIAAVMGVPTLRVNVLGYDGKENYNDIFKKDTDNFSKIVEFSKKHKVKPLFEIHMGTIIASASAALRFASQWKSDEIGVIHDAGNMVYEGFENYKMGIEMLGKYLSHVHIKNAVKLYEPVTGAQPLLWKTAAAPLRTGCVNFKELITALKETGYDGWLSIEDFSTVMTQEEKVRDGIAFIKEIEKSI
ncbi:MAG: sugar phosphate isomerase/epimerase [Fibrobacteres bacterium]|nr:sugar phosphate isomerase/epimerase [Fibrobacterota bacterium]